VRNKKGPAESGPFSCFGAQSLLELIVPSRQELLQSKGEAVARLREQQQQAKLEQEVLRMDTEAVMATALDEAQLRGIAKASIDREAPGGLKWRKTGEEPPNEGRQLENAKLASALAARTEFSQAEWDVFGIKSLRSSDFVVSGGSYFRPVVAATLHHAAKSCLALGSREATGSENEVVETPEIRRGKDVMFHSAVAGEEVELKDGWTRLGQRKGASLARNTQRAVYMPRDTESGGEEDEEEQTKKEEAQLRKDRLQHLVHLCARIRADMKSAHENLRGLRLRSKYVAAELFNCVKFASEPSRKAVEACLADLVLKHTPLLPSHVMEVCVCMCVCIHTHTHTHSLTHTHTNTHTHAHTHTHTHTNTHTNTHRPSKLH
jgi:hypothetical protein